MTSNRQPPWDVIEQHRRDKAAKAPGAPADAAGCTGPACGAKIRWAITTTGQRIPVDWTPDPEGNLIRIMVAAGDWRIRPLAPDETPDPSLHRWTAHWATCPDAHLFRAGRPEPAPPHRPVLLAVDGDSLAHRAYHAQKTSGLCTPDGRPLWAVRGFLSLLAGICDKTRPDGLLVGFDDRNASYRRGRYPRYKAGRPPKDPALLDQLDDIQAVLHALGVRVSVPEQWEADDVTASAAAAAERAGWRCVIATSDRDAYAAISDTTSVLRLKSGLDNAEWTTPTVLGEQVGVGPGQWLDFRALTGDRSDNLPGVPGIGPKTAAKLLAAAGSLAAALADPDATAAAIGPALAAQLASEQVRKDVARNLEIMAPRRNLPVDVAACRPTVTRTTVAAVLRDWHLPMLTARLSTALRPPTNPAPGTAGPPGVPAPRRAKPDPPQFAPDTPRPVCPDCGRPAGAAIALARLEDPFDTGGRVPVLTGETVLVDRQHPHGDLVAVPVGDVWAVRPVTAGEYHIAPRARRQSHRCPVYPAVCAVCGQPGNLYACGPRCPDHAPGRHTG